MQRGRRAVESDISHQLAPRRQRIQRVGVRDLMDEAALLQHVEKIRFKSSHWPGYSDHPYFTVFPGKCREASLGDCRVSAPCGIIRTGCSTQVAPRTRGASKAPMP